MIMQGGIPDRAKAPEIREFGELVMPDVTKSVLDNGIPLYRLDHGNQEACCLTCVWRGGVAESSAKSLPALVLSMMREGTANHDGEEIADIIEYNGAKLFVSADSHFSTLKLYTLNSMAANVIPLLPEMMLKPTFPEKNFEVLREKVAKNEEIKRAKVEAQAAIAINRMVMGEGHPLAVDETPEEIRRYTRDDLLRWHKKVFIPVVDDTGESSMTLFLAGRITPEIERLVRDLFGSMPVKRGTPLPFDIVEFDCRAAAEERIRVDGALQSAVRMAVPAIGREHPDYIALRLLVMALGGYFGSRLMSNIREDKGYTYGINSYLLGYPEGGIIGISSSTDNSTVDPLIEETIREIKRLSTGDFEEEEMKRLRQHAMSSLASSLDSPFDIMDYYINRLVAFIPSKYFERQVAAVKSLTAEELARVAREHFSLDRLNIAVAGA